MTPSYPKYYLSGEQCSWRLSLAPHLSLLVRVMDLQVRGPAHGQHRCQDGLTLDNKITLCGEQMSELHYVTSSNAVNINFHIGQDYQYIYPMRGYLLQLTPIGCSAPASSRHMSLVHFNSTHAQYSCTQQGFVFQDTSLPTETLICVGNHYDKVLSPCVRYAVLPLIT